MKYDEIGYWSELKLEIIRKYAQAYSRILARQRDPELYHVYIDGFAGAGLHLSKTHLEFIPGSPLNALAVKPPFREFHLIDLRKERTESLRNLTEDIPNVQVYEGDCNRVLLDQVFPKVRWEDYRRGLCILDPYGLHLDWTVIQEASKMKTIEIFLNFPIMDMNMNVLRHDAESVDPKQIARMNAFWGDESWRGAAYDTTQDFFNFPKKTDNDAVAQAFKKRLTHGAEFGHVPDPIPMRNTQGATVYYLFFASHRPVAGNIVSDIFEKYRNRGVSSV